MTVEEMLKNKTLDRGKLIPVKITKDTKIPSFLEPMTVANGWAEDLCQKLLETLEQDTSVNSTHIQHDQQEDFCRKYLHRKQQIVCFRAKRFTPPTMNPRYQVDISDMFTELELLKGNNSDELRPNQPTTLTDVLEMIENTPACKCLIVGDGGIGKTTLLKYLAYTSSIKSIKPFKGKIVFLLNARDLEKGKGILDLIEKQLNLEDLSLNENLSEDSKIIRRFIMNHDDNIVLLLDGLDELRFQNESLIRLFRKETLEKSVIILTSRRTESIYEFINECDVHVNINGFDDESIRKYIDKHFQYFESPKLGKSLTKELVDRKPSEVYSLSKNPMLLLSLCILWEDKQSLPVEDDLFKEISRSILNQFIEKEQQNWQKISKFNDAPTEFVNAMMLLGKCMYYNLKENNLSLNRRDLIDNGGSRDLVDMALRLGFVYRDALISKSDFEEIYMPLHKLIVESLVGFYLSKLCESEGNDNACAEGLNLLTPLDEHEWKVIRESDYFIEVRKIAIGFLGADAGQFLRHWITNDLSTYVSLMGTHWDCVEKQHEDNVERALINYSISNTTSEVKQLTDDVSKSLRVFIRHVFQDEHFDGHFIHLIRTLHSFPDSHSLRMFYQMNRCKGIVLAHIVCLSTCKNIEMKQCNLSGVVVNDMIREWVDRGVNLRLRYLDVSGNDLSNTDGTLLGSFLIMSPGLQYLGMHDCKLSSDIITCMVEECWRQKCKFTLQTLNISSNDLSTIASVFLSYLMFRCTMLHTLDMHSCNLSGNIMNDLITECSFRKVELRLRNLNISSNNFNNIDGTLLGSLLSMVGSRSLSPNTYLELDMHDCNLSGAVINSMINECSEKEAKMALRKLNISGNHFSDTDGTLLGSLLVMSPGLHYLDMHDCDLSGVVMNNTITECCNKGVKLPLLNLDISGNNLTDIDGTLLGSLIIMCTSLEKLIMHHCYLSGTVFNSMITEYSNRNVELKSLKYLNISGNDFSNIDGTLLCTLLTTFPCLIDIDMQECNQSNVAGLQDFKTRCHNKVKLKL
ncbi:uncharacterized protein [Antedon mediterranea]|uniref:uncharacterized protein n=1 Tax=Antedon mediterranea TaxID=105859 RepID=UPI003AF73DE8